MPFHPVPYYCEENVWHLCHDPRVTHRPRAVLIISNASRCVAVGAQRAAPDPSSPVLWDYHVVLVAREHQGWSVWDVDTTLGLPVPLSVYLEASFALPEGYGEALAPYFRVVEASRYRSTLATDRRHMQDAQGHYQAPPPPWPVIGTGSNLMRLIDMNDPIVGTIVDLDGVPGALEALQTAPAP